MAQRLLSVLLTIWLAATLCFFTLRVLPGDAIAAQLAQSGASQDSVEQLRVQMGLDAPIISQYAQFLAGLTRGDLGTSLLSGQPVSAVIAQRFIPTMRLAVSAMLVATTAGIGIGVAGAFDSLISSASRFIINLAISTPIYWTGTLAIVLFSAQLGWLPSTGTGRLQHLALPVSVLGFHTMGGIARVTQANVANAWHASFVWVARSKGLPESHLIWRHTLKAGLLPVITVIALQMGFLLSGTVITESLFARPGIGRLLLDSTIKQDYPIVQGVVILSAVIYVTLTALADFLQRVVDPRITL